MRLILAGLALAAAVPGASPPAAASAIIARSANDRYQLATFTYQNEQARAAYARIQDAKLVALRQEIDAKDATLGRALREAAASRRSNAAALAQADRLRADLTGLKTRFTDELARRDAEFARERSLLQSVGDRLIATPEGARALELYNAGGEGSYEAADTILAATAKLRAAADQRDRAVLALDARAKGRTTTAVAIARWEAVVALDADRHWDWVELARLYYAANRLDRALGASAAAMRTASNARDRAVALEERGDLLMLRDDLSAALAAYEEALAINRKLAALAPASAEAQRGIFVSLDRTGSVRAARNDTAGALAAYSEGLEIAQKLAALDPNSPEAQRDVSASLNRIGDMWLARGELSGALLAYNEGLMIRRKLAARYPSSATAQHDVAASLNRVGDVQAARNDVAAAVAAYEEGLSTARKLVEHDQTSAVAQRGVLLGLWGLATVKAPSRSWRDVIGQFEVMAGKGMIRPVDMPFVETARRNAAAER